MKRFIGALTAVVLGAGLANAGGGDWDPAGGPGINLASNIGVNALREFNGALYIGTENPSVGARIYKTLDGISFTAVMTGGFGAGVTKITEFVAFGGYLYCGTASPTGGAVYRSSDGTTWTMASPLGFGSASNSEVPALDNFAGKLWAGTRNTGGGGGQLWNSSDGTTWTSITTSGFGDADNVAILDLENDGFNVYAGTENGIDGGQLWRISSSGGTNVEINDGFGTADNSAFSALEFFRGELFIGTKNTVHGYELWATSDLYNYYRRIDDGFGDSANRLVTDLEEFNGVMFVGVEAVGESFEVLSTVDGFGFEQEGSDGFGDPGAFRLNRFAAYGNEIWTGTSNPAGGVLYHAEVPDGWGSSRSSDDHHHRSNWRTRIRCFVASAAYGSPAAPRVAELRRIRDERVEACEAGRRFTDLYRLSAPPVAQAVGKSEVLRAVLRRALFK